MSRTRDDSFHDYLNVDSNKNFGPDFTGDLLEAYANECLSLKFSTLMIILNDRYTYSGRYMNCDFKLLLNILREHVNRPDWKFSKAYKDYFNGMPEDLDGAKMYYSLNGNYESLTALGKDTD